MMRMLAGLLTSTAFRPCGPALTNAVVPLTAMLLAPVVAGTNSIRPLDTGAAGLLTSKTSRPTSFGMYRSDS